MFRYIQAYSVMIVIVTLTFFFHFNVTYLSTNFNLDMFLGYNDVNFNAPLSLLKSYVTFGNNAIME